MKTAEECYKSIVGDTPDNLDQHPCTIEVIQEFAKLHVKAALEVAKNDFYNNKNGNWIGEDILNAYPLENIK